ncbi:MAG: MFS transporter [Nitrospirae bacterium]|nr:MFS transporter [Nitrospirota bacterium]
MITLNKKRIISWVLFDFANSSYSAVIAAVVFPIYYAQTIVGNEDGYGDLWWGRAISISMGIVAFTAPLLGGIADYRGLRKKFLFIYTIISVCAIASLPVVEKGMIFEGFLLIVVANVGMEGGLVFYNSFLPRIAPLEYQGRISAWGYMIGYVGSIISLLLALPLVKSGRYDAAWLMVAIFFFIFSLPAFFFLPQDKKGQIPLIHAGLKGMKHTLIILREIFAKKELRKYLISFFIYEDGVNTVIVFSSIFAATTFGFTPQELIALFLVVQTTAFWGSLLLAKPIDFWGPKKVVIISLLMWTSVSIFAFFAHTKTEFWIIAIVAGFGLGTVQAASRALYSQFIPEGKEAEYFGVYSMAGKSSAVLGPLIFGYLSTTFGNQRPAIISVAVFFIVGLVILSFVSGGGPNIKK